MGNTNTAARARATKGGGVLPKKVSQKSKAEAVESESLTIPSEGIAVEISS